MPLTDRQRRCGDCGFERGFLGGEVALDIAVVKHAPAIACGDNGILSKSHGSTPYILLGLLFGWISLLLSGTLARPLSPLSSLPPDVEVPLPLGLDFIELPVVWEAPGVAELPAGSPVVAPRPLSAPACAKCIPDDADVPPLAVPLLEAPVAPAVADGQPAFELPLAVPLALCADFVAKVS
jgi:hypothetical protein